MPGRPRAYAVAAIAACLGAHALWAAAAFSQTSADGSGGAAAPATAPLGSGSGGTAAAPGPGPLLHIAQQSPAAAPSPPEQQRPSEEAPDPEQRARNGSSPESKQERKLEVPVARTKPASVVPGLSPVGALARSLPATGAEPLTLALTGLALLALGAAVGIGAGARPPTRPAP